MKFRETTPKRQNITKEVSDYHEHKINLQKDFRGHCGYCNDRDWPRREFFEIDHFVPKVMLTTIKDTDYSNLAYSCRSCNNAKRKKWPTGKEHIHNDGNQGWIDPCCDEYDKQFEREENGKIIPVTPLGKWMYDELKLHKRQHQILWNIEQLDETLKALKPFIDFPESLDSSICIRIIKIYNSQHKLLEELYKI